MRNLPTFQTDDRDFQLMQSTWSSALTPLLNSPMLNGRLISEQPLVAGLNVINHKLGRKLQGWVIVRQRAAATFYDTQDANTSPALTLDLQSTGTVVVDLYVF